MILNIQKKKRLLYSEEPVFYAVIDTEKRLFNTISIVEIPTQIDILPPENPPKPIISFDEVEKIKIIEDRIFFREIRSKHSVKNEFKDVLRLAIMVHNEPLFIDEMMGENDFDDSMFALRKQGEQLAEIFQVPLEYEDYNGNKNIRQVDELNKPYYYFLKDRKHLMDTPRKNPYQKSDVEGRFSFGKYIINFKKNLSYTNITVLLIFYFFMFIIFFCTSFLLGVYLSPNNIWWLIWFIACFCKCVGFMMFMSLFYHAGQITIEKNRYIYFEKFLNFTYTRIMEMEKIENIEAVTRTHKLRFLSDEKVMSFSIDTGILENVKKQIDIGLINLFY